ncbi:MAG TPA: DUF1592 domain-containing protein [Polyangiaceae bacterium]
MSAAFVATLGAFCFAFAAAGCAPSSGPAASAAHGEGLLPARVRRLSNVEYERTLEALLGKAVPVARALPPDVRQDGYTRNAAQAVPPGYGTRLSALVRDAVASAVGERLEELLPCHPRSGDACRDAFVADAAFRAFRRPVGASEKAALERLFDAGARGEAGFRGGVELVLRALLESPSLLYLRELGPAAPPGGVVTLGPYQVASSLSYFLRGAPPDAELYAAARRGELSTGEGRERQARRLLGHSGTRHQFRQFVMEWLEIDALDQAAKSETLFPEFERLRPHMLAETRAFVDEVMVNEGASLASLVDAGFAAVDPAMARFYALDAYGARVPARDRGRAGLLQQASFLSAHAHPDMTSPVKRGDFVLRRMLCIELPRPAELDIEIVMPRPLARQTARERFIAHSADPSCRSCHALIDPLGYVFEGFDAMGKTRAIDAGKPLRTAADVAIRGERRYFADSAALSAFLARNVEAKQCYLRQAFRFFSAQTDADAERAFLEVVLALPDERRDNLLEALVAYVKSDLFARRKVPAP